MRCRSRRLRACRRGGVGLNFCDHGNACFGILLLVNVKWIVEEVLRASVYFVFVGGMNTLMAVLLIGARTACCRRLVRQLLLFCEFCSSSTLASTFAENNLSLIHI